MHPRISRQSDYALATGAGVVLGALFYAVGKARTGRGKALHPRGRICQAVLDRHGCPRSTGVPWLDEPGRDEVLVRLSRATGLPRPLPDVFGLALRVPLPPHGHADLLLASTGTGALSRFLLRPTRREHTAYTCLLPYQARSGALLLAALPLRGDGLRFALACSSPMGQWRPFGVLRLPESQDGPDADISFDPVLHPLPELPNYRWVAQLRRFAYAGSRRSRGASTG